MKNCDAINVNNSIKIVEKASIEDLKAEGQILLLMQTYLFLNNSCMVVVCT